MIFIFQTNDYLAGCCWVPTSSKQVVSNKRNPLAQPATKYLQLAQHKVYQLSLSQSPLAQPSTKYVRLVQHTVCQPSTNPLTYPRKMYISQAISPLTKPGTKYVSLLQHKVHQPNLANVLLQSLEERLMTWEIIIPLLS